MPAASLPVRCECGNQLVEVEVVVSVRDSFANTLTDMIPDKGSMRLVQPERKTGFFSGKTNQTEVFALTCSVCGKTTLYAREPENILPDR